MIRVVVGLVFVGMLMLCAARRNCGYGAECDSCHYKKNILVCSDDEGCNFVDVCCKTCDSFFITGHQIKRGRLEPYCTCKSDLINGTCWKGDQCDDCQDSKSINGVPVCCQGCEGGELSISRSSCNCGPTHKNDTREAK